MLAAILAFSPLRKALLAAAGALILMGFGAAVWDRVPIIGPHAKIERLKARVYDETGKATWWAGYAANRETARKACEGARLSERDHGADNITEAAQRASQGSTAAFNAGYSAGKTAGRAACPKGTPANASNPADPAGPVPDVVRDEDLAASFNASIYRPGGSVRP